MANVDYGTLPPLPERGPDGRLRATRIGKVIDAKLRTAAELSAVVLLPIATPLPGYPTLVLDHVQLEMPSKGETLPRIVEHYLEATSTLTQVGREIIDTDEDNRKTTRATYVILAASAYTAGVPGTTLFDAFDATTVLQREQDSASMAVRTITRWFSKKESTATIIGPAIPDFPFDELGDPNHVIVSRTIQCAADQYAPLALNSAASFTVGGASQTLYYIGDRPPRREGAGDLRTVRRWASVPATRTEPETYAFSYPGFRFSNATNGDPVQGREGFTDSVTSVITLEFFMVGAGQTYASAEAIPRYPKQTWIQHTGFEELATPKSALDIYLYDTARWYFYSGYTAGLRTTPTRTAYEALIAAGGFPLVAECRIDRYEGNIYVRRTRRVPAL